LLNLLTVPVGPLTANLPKIAVIDKPGAGPLAAIALMKFTRLGPKDALRLPPTFYRAGEMATRRSKTGEPLFWPYRARKGDFGHRTNARCGHPMRQLNRAALDGRWLPVPMEDGAPRLEQQGWVAPLSHLCGLRHTVAAILREAGADEHSSIGLPIVQL
jgi:hypothetical protein